jgi:hypothetical protein
MLFLGYITETEFETCPCSDCIVKMVCNLTCEAYSINADKYLQILSSKAIPQIEFIINAYRRHNMHLPKRKIDVYNITRTGIINNDGWWRTLSGNDEKRVIDISTKYKRLMTKEEFGNCFKNLAGEKEI